MRLDSEPVRRPHRRRLGAVLAVCAALLAAAAPARAEPGWLATHDLSVGANSRVGGVAVGPDGTVTTAAVHNEGFQRWVEAAVKPAGQPFGAPVRLSDPNGTPSYSLTRGDRAGNVVIAWEESQDGTSVIRAATKPAGGAFTPTQTISDTGTSSRWPRVDIAGGKAIVTWAQNGRLRAATATAGGPFTVHNPLTGFIKHDSPAEVAAGPDGAAVVTYTTHEVGKTVVHATARAAGGSFTPLPDVATVPQSYMADDHVAMSPEGRTVLAWLYYDSPSKRYVLQSASRGKAGQFGGVQTVASYPVGNTSSTYFALAVSDDDTALLAWRDSHLRYSQRPLGGGFGANAAIAGADSGSTTIPQAAFAGDGSAFLLFRGADGARSRLCAARLAPDGTFASSGFVAPPSDAPAGEYDATDVSFTLATNAGGDAVASWSQTHDAAAGSATNYRYRVRTALLDTTPPVLSAVNVPRLGFRGREVVMSAKISDALTGATATWNFGDGTTEEGEQLTKIYDDAGAYTVTLTVTDGAGNTTTAERTIEIEDRRPPL